MIQSVLFQFLIHSFFAGYEFSVNFRMSFIKGVEQIANKKVFYENALKYWDRVPPTLDGVMGGLPMLSGVQEQRRNY